MIPAGGGLSQEPDQKASIESGVQTASPVVDQRIVGSPVGSIRTIEAAGLSWTRTGQTDSQTSRQAATQSR